MSLLSQVRHLCIILCMTTMPSGRIPEFTLGWRLRLALHDAGISVEKMAADLGYSRATLSRWLNDQDPPRAAVMAQWALLTGVSRDWLESGTTTPPPPGPGLDTSKLDRVTEQKRRRTRGNVATRRYLVPALTAA